MNDKESPLSCVPSGGRKKKKKTTKPKWRQPYHGHLTLNATPFWSNMCFIVALMDLRFQGFWVYWFISYTLSSEGYCRPAWNVRRCGWYGYYEWVLLVFECGELRGLKYFSHPKKKNSASRLASSRRLRWIRMCSLGTFACCVFCMRARPLANYLICLSCCTIFSYLDLLLFVSCLWRIRAAHTHTQKKSPANKKS